MEANNILFRASSMGKIMTGVKKKWSVEDSLTCKRELVALMRQYKYGRRPKIANKYTKKGNIAEESSITLYTIVKGRFYRKNEERRENEYFSGECDLFDGETFFDSNEIVDTKSSWSMATFPSFLDEETDDDYMYQGLVYMALSKATKHIVAHCLVNTPATLLMDEKYRLKKKHEIIDIETPEYIEDCKELEKESIFDMGLFLKDYPWFELHTPMEEWDYDIPEAKRVHEVEVFRDEAKIEGMIDRIKECRDWMNRNWHRI
jgi:hypothetical protein